MAVCREQRQNGLEIDSSEKVKNDNKEQKSNVNTQTIEENQTYLHSEIPTRKQSLVRNPANENPVSTRIQTSSTTGKEIKPSQQQQTPVDPPSSSTANSHQRTNNDKVHSSNSKTCTIV